MQTYIVRGNFAKVVNAESAEKAEQMVSYELQQDYDCEYVIVENSEVIE